MICFDLCLFWLIVQLCSVMANVSPKLDEFKQRRFQKVRTKLKLVCVTQEGSKPFRFEWFRDGLSLHKDQFKIDDYDEESHFTIPKLTLSDSANYSCLVSNQFGTDKQWTLLSVQGLKQFFEFSCCFVERYVAH